MTRKKKEIRIASHDKRNYPCHVIVDEIHDPILFLIGAEWADKTMIEKSCEWLKANINNYLVRGRDIDYLFDDYKKAMEE